ncbi:MAG TPA: GTPase HflX, partial [Actinobacteria bacterium]|nr:GTPase HflX [Actinomycetota bacterium]
SAVVRRLKPTPATLIGKGQARGFAEETTALDVDVVVFDNDLTPAQQRNLQAIFQCDVVDRVALILDIFAQHATSKEGMLQVELALLKYHLPRLRGKGVTLSRQAGAAGGSIATRGPGETKLETDRRRITSRIAMLERQLREVRKFRNTQRKSRRSSALPKVSLVGYTNAGKSTLLNTLTEAGVLTEDRLFSTLDSTTRRWDLAGGQRILVSDTVGFVRSLPHQLVEAFASTLEEVADADLLLHLVDTSDAEATNQITAVREVLETIEAATVPEIIVLNKADKADPAALERLKRLYPDAPIISALRGTGMDDLHSSIATVLARGSQDMELLIPFERGEVLAEIYREAEVIAEAHDETGTVLTARISRSRLARYEEFATETPS